VTVDAGSWIQQIVSSTNLPLLAALLIGVLASIGPCPLATNVVALSYAARQFDDRRAVLASGGLYALGRAAAYTVVGAAIVVAGARVSSTARGLQDFADVALGPLLVLVGLVMLGVLTIPAAVTGSGRMTRFGERMGRRGGLGAFALGFMFALAFCPYSAALFFGVLVPMALAKSGGLGLPAAFGVGTSAPVLILGVPLALGIERAAGAVHSVEQSEVLVRRSVAVVFVVVGVALTVRALGIGS
jgi:cytochrome c-type biogenesis protein